MSEVSIIYKNGKPYEFVMGENVKHDLHKQKHMPFYMYQSKLFSMLCTIIVCKTSAKVTFTDDEGVETTRIFRINKPDTPRYSGQVTLTRLT